MQVINTARFERSMEFVISCGRNIYSRNIIRQFYDDYKKYRTLLSSSPRIGQKELLLEGEGLDYRYVFIKPYFKIIYLIQDETLYLVDVWDVRQEPQNLQSRINGA